MKVYYFRFDTYTYNYEPVRIDINTTGETEHSPKYFLFAKFYVFLDITCNTILLNSKATNPVGLKTSRTFGAFQVDGSTPFEGHVYDSPAATYETHLRDYDWVTEMKSLCASWEGFHDPHSAIVGYTWEIGLCEGCSDVLVKQFVGLDNSMSFLFQIFHHLLNDICSLTFAY